MMKPRISLFAEHEREDRRTKIGDPLIGLTKHVDFEALAAGIDEAAPRPSRTKGGRPPYPTVLMVKILVLQQLYNLADDALEYQLLDRRSFLQFLDLTESSSAFLTPKRSGCSGTAWPRPAGCVALLIRRRNFPGKEQGCLKLDGLVLPAHKIGRRTTSHRRDRFVNWPLRIMCMSSTPASTQPAPRNDLRLSIGLVTRLMARWSCSTMLLRCLTWRTTIGTSRPALTASMAALLAPLLSMATLSGAPFSRMALSKKRFAAAMSRLAVRRKSMVFPCLSTAR